MQPSQLVSMLVLFFAMLFATVEAANRLEFGQVRDVVTLFIKFGGNIVLGGTILTIGFWLAIGVRAQCGRQATYVTGARTTSLS